MQFLSLCIVIAVTLLMMIKISFASGENVTSQVTQETNNATSGNFSQGAFRYRIGNTISNQYREEHRDSKGVVRGSYGFRTPLGEFREVKYMADGAGFRAQVISNEPGVSQQNPADVQVQKVYSQQHFDNQKGNQQLLVPGGYPIQNNLTRREMLNPSMNNPQHRVPAIVYRAQLSTIQDKKERLFDHGDHSSRDLIQNEPKFHPDSLEVPLKGNTFINPYNKHDRGLHSSQLRFREKFLGGPQKVLPNIVTSTPKLDQRHLSKNDFLSSAEQQSVSPYPHRNKWVLGFIPFGIRADHINDITKKLSSSQNRPETNDIPNPTIFFDLKSATGLPNHSNKKNCKLDDAFNLAQKNNQLLREDSKESHEQKHKLSAFESDIGSHGFEREQSKQSGNEDNDIYLIQSIFAKRLAGIINSGGIFPPHLLPHSIREPNQNPQLGIRSYQDINHTQLKTAEWNTGHVSQDIFEDKSKENFDITGTNLNSLEKWKDNPFPLRPISISLSGKPTFPETLSRSQNYPSEDTHAHKIGRRGESGRGSPSGVSGFTKSQNKEQSDEIIVRNFYDGKVYSTHIKNNNDRQNKIEDANSDLISDSFHENSDVNNGRIRTTINNNLSSALELPEWAGRHRLFEIPQLNRPLYDSKGVQIKPEDVPVHLHRFMPPKPQNSNRDNSFRFAIPRPVPPRSVVIPPKPPLML